MNPVNERKSILEHLEVRCDIDEVKVISINLFDTLVFQRIHSSDDIFQRVGAAALKAGHFSNDLSPKEFAKIRAHIERLLLEDKSEGHQEPTLMHIYQSLPTFIHHRSAMMKIELDIIQANSFVHEQVHTLMNIFRELNKRLVLVSDTCLSQPFIELLLEKIGVDRTLIDRIYLSSEENASKRKGTIFKKVLADFAIKPEQLLHIGSNLNHDVLRPKKIGIQTYYYDLQDSKGCLSLEAEQQIAGKLSPELMTIRKTVCDQYSENSRDGFWYDFGASIMGPVLTMFAEWVIDQAEQNGIQTLFTMMREGALLSPLLKKAASKRGYLCNIKTLYISRQVVLFAGLNTVDETLLRKVMIRRGMALKKVFEILGIDDGIEVFRPYFELDYFQYRNIQVGASTLYKKLIAFLLSEKVVPKIMSVIQKANDSCRAYLQQEIISEDYITVDIGYSASTQRGMAYLLPQHAGKKIHLLLFASETPTLHANIFEYDTHPGTIDIRGFFDTYGLHSKMIADIYTRNRPFELLMMNEEGTTVGYESFSDHVQPVLKQMPSMTPQQLADIALCQKGVSRFQDEYLATPGQSAKEISNVDKAQLLMILYRVLMHPTHAEAMYLGGMKFDENNGADYVVDICEHANVHLIRQHGLDELIRTKLRRNILWPEGLLMLADRDFSSHNKLTFLSELQEDAWMLVRRVVRDDIDHVIVCGVGDIGRFLAVCLGICGVTVEAFIDNNVLLQGMVVDGIRIDSFDASHLSTVYMVSSFQHKAFISNQIREKKGNDSRIYTF